MKGFLITVLFVALSSAAVVKNIREDDIPIGDNNDDPSQAAAICAGVESEGVLVAHEYCNKFYKCNFGVPVALNCPTILLFDPTKDRCDWPDTVECGERTISENNENNPGENEWTGNGAGNDDPSKANEICAAEGSDHSYVAHENCNQFYQCWAGQPVALFCPFDYLFNPAKDYCDFPYNVDCGNRLIPINHGNNNGNGNPAENKIEEEDIPVGNNFDDPSQAAAICRGDESEGILIAHEYCNQYYKCNFGIPIALECAPNLLFDPTRDRCEWRGTVDCGNRIVPELVENVPEWNEPGAGNDDPSQANAICAVEGSDNTYVAHENCNQFYQCWAGNPVALFCPVGFLFNPNKDYCDYPQNVDCGNRLV